MERYREEAAADEREDMDDLQMYPEIGSEGDTEMENGERDRQIRAQRDREVSDDNSEAHQKKRNIKLTEKAVASKMYGNMMGRLAPGKTHTQPTLQKVPVDDGRKQRLRQRQTQISPTPRMSRMQKPPVANLGQTCEQDAEVAKVRAKLAQQAQKLAAMQQVLNKPARASPVATSPVRRLSDLSPRTARVGARQRSLPHSPLALQRSASRLGANLKSQGRRGVNKPKKKEKRIGKASFVVESSDEEQGSKASPASQSRRRRALDAATEMTFLSQEAFQQRSLMLGVAMLEELSKQTKILQKLSNQSQTQGSSPTSGSSQDKDFAKKLADSAATICSTLAKQTMYPGPADIQQAVMHHLGCSTLAEAHQKHSLRDVTLLVSQVEKRFSKILRPAASSYVKTKLIHVYAIHYPEMIRENSNGQKFLVKSILDKLKSDGHHHCTVEGNAQREPYSCPAFRSLLAQTFSKGVEIDNWEPSQSITWLGRGQVAFVDCLVAWLLLGHNQIPKEGEEDHALYKEMHQAALETCDRAKAMEINEILFAV